MKTRNVLISSIFILNLFACSGSGSEGESADKSENKTPINVAASVNGAVATSNFNAETAKNLIDEDEDTTWISDPEEPILVEFDSIKTVTTITIKKVDSIASIGSNPDILVELSKDGIIFQPSAVSNILSPVNKCTHFTSNSEQLFCKMIPLELRFIRITSQNGMSYEFKELEVIGY